MKKLAVGLAAMAGLALVTTAAPAAEAWYGPGVGIWGQVTGAKRTITALSVTVTRTSMMAAAIVRAPIGSTITPTSTAIRTATKASASQKRKAQRGPSSFFAIGRSGRAGVYRSRPSTEPCA